MKREGALKECGEEKGGGSVEGVSDEDGENEKQVDKQMLRVGWGKRKKHEEYKKKKGTEGKSEIG